MYFCLVREHSAGCIRVSTSNPECPGAIPTCLRIQAYKYIFYSPVYPWVWQTTQFNPWIGTRSAGIISPHKENSSRSIVHVKHYSDVFILPVCCRIISALSLHKQAINHQATTMLYTTKNPISPNNPPPPPPLSSPPPP